MWCKTWCDVGEVLVADQVSGSCECNLNICMIC
jgi:hypothetical protein